MCYLGSNTNWLANCRYGISVHWTAQTMPRKGPPLPFQQAVDAFNIGAFIEGVVESGADYLIFTVTHALQTIPGPNPVVDAILPGRTCQRDLLAELAQRLSQHGKHLVLYYNHSCNGGGDPEWEKAVGYHAPSKQCFAANVCEIVAWMGRRYGETAKAWWFDSSYSLDPRGPHNSVTTDMSGFQFPWERLTESAKAGYAQRLVTYNAGIDQTFLYTTHQDYWAGEMKMINANQLPKGRYLQNGLQWHGWTCLDDRHWVHDKPDKEAPAPLYSDEDLFQFVSICRQHSVPMTFNAVVFQDGRISFPAVQTLKRLGERLS